MIEGAGPGPDRPCYFFSSAPPSALTAAGFGAPLAGPWISWTYFCPRIADSTAAMPESTAPMMNDMRSDGMNASASVWGNQVVPSRVATMLCGIPAAIDVGRAVRIASMGL